MAAKFIPGFLYSMSPGLLSADYGDVLFLRVLAVRDHGITYSLEAWTDHLHLDLKLMQVIDLAGRYKAQRATLDDNGNAVVRLSNQPVGFNCDLVFEP